MVRAYLVERVMKWYKKRQWQVIEILICIGAPTSLAIDLAVACSITLVGFVSDKGYNIYTCESRILSTVN